MANRWPPWIEARIASTARITVNAIAAPQALTGMSLTVTAKIKSRLAIHAVFDVEYAVFAAGSMFLASLFVDGVQRAAPLAVWSPPALAGRMTLASAPHVEDVAAGATVVFGFRVQQVGAVGTWVVYEFGHTAFDVVAMPFEGMAY